MHIAKKMFGLLVVSVLATSCSTPKSINILTDIDNQISGQLAAQQYTTTIEPESELLITVKSLVPEAAQEFNTPYVNTVPSGGKTLPSERVLQTYKVDPQGNIDFPRLGVLHVGGKTVYEVKEMLLAKLTPYIKDPIVTVELTGYRVSVLGEAKSPKVIYPTQDRFSILDALAQCGDLTEYAVRDNILVIRRTPDNQLEYGHINLQKSDMTQSDFFWLRNNDVVVVPTNDIKTKNAQLNQLATYRLSVISTVLSSVLGLASVIVALSVK